MAKLIEDNAEFKGATFRNSDLEGVTFNEVNMQHALFREADLLGATIEARIDGMTVNGFRVDHLIHAELLRRFPERAKLAAETPEGFQDALEYIHVLRAKTLDVPKRLRTPPLSGRPRASGPSSSSFVTSFSPRADGSTASRSASPTPFHALSLPPDIARESMAKAGFKVVASTTLSEVRAALEGTSNGVRERFAGLDAAGLKKPANNPDQPMPVSRALEVYLNHEWDHHYSMGEILDKLEAG